MLAINSRVIELVSTTINEYLVKLTK